MKIAQKNDFRVSETVKLIIKIDSSQSHTNIRNYLKLPKPIKLRDFFRNLSRNSEHEKTLCNDLISPFFILHVIDGFHILKLTKDRVFAHCNTLQNTFKPHFLSKHQQELHWPTFMSTFSSSSE